jgi:hypothetical protein
VGIAGTQDRGDQLVGVAVEDEQRVVHVLAIVAVIARPFLRAVGRVVGRVEIEHDPRRGAAGGALAQIDQRQRPRDPVASAQRDGILQAREGRLAGEGWIGPRQATADEPEQRIVAQRVGVILILVAAGDLIDALADEGGEGMRAGFASPLGNAGGDLGTDAGLRVGMGEPGQPAIGGERSAVEGGVEGEGGEGFEREGGCGRIGHEEASRVGRWVSAPTIPNEASSSQLPVMNNPG